MPEHNWCWKVDLQNFEEIHGMSRVVRLVPDKVSTTGAIMEDENVEGKPDFLLKLVSDLTSIFVARSLTRLSQEITGEGETWRTVICSEGHDENGAYPECDSTFGAAIVDFTDQLQRCKNAAADNASENFWQEGKKLIQMSQAFGEACAVYLEIAHPALLDLNKSGMVSWDTLRRSEFRLEGNIRSLRTTLNDANPRCL